MSIHQTADHILSCLRVYADQVLEHGRDTSGRTPLFYDGVNAQQYTPVEWVNADGEVWQPSNLASQQNLFRFLAGLSSITDTPCYINAAKASIAWHFEHADASGLLYWGGHTFYDLATLTVVGPENKSQVHELKHHCPFYELMFEVSPNATQRLITATWNAHVSDWQTLAMSRHGEYGKNYDANEIWDKPEPPELTPLREMKGLSFVNIGNDLIYGAALLGVRDGFSKSGEKSMAWAKLLMQQYINARHPETDLGCYQYNRPEKRGEPPVDESHPEFTFSFWGDRAQRQFGPEHGEAAQEAWVLFKLDEAALNGPEGIYGDCALAQTQMARALGEQGQWFLERVGEGLEAWLQYAYDPVANEIKPMFADGKDLTGERVKRNGYYGKKGQVFTRRPLPVNVFLATAVQWQARKTEALWQALASMAKHFDLGDWQVSGGVAKTTHADDALILLAVLAVYEGTKDPEYLQLAERVAKNVLARSFSNGWLLPSCRHRYCRFDDPEALALLRFVAAVKEQDVPRYVSRGGYIHGDYRLASGEVKNTLDLHQIYTQLN